MSREQMAEPSSAMMLPASQSMTQALPLCTWAHMSQAAAVSAADRLHSYDLAQKTVVIWRKVSGEQQESLCKAGNSDAQGSHHNIQ